MSILLDMHTDDQQNLDGDAEVSLAWEWRVFAVSLFGLCPGIVAGAIACLAVPCDCRLGCLLAGGILGAIVGGLLEADHL